MEHETQNEQAPDWPNSSLFLFGYFGWKSPGGKKAVINSLLASLLFVVGLTGIYLFETLALRMVSAALSPAAIVVLIVSSYRYLSGLDALSQLILLKGYALAYGAALVIGAGLFAFSIPMGINLSPIFILFAEPFRGLFTYLIARKYQ